jgi:starch phosphorylase
MLGGGGAAESLALWKQRVRQAWPAVQLRRLVDTPREMPRAGMLHLRVAAALNGLLTDDVRVEFLAQRVLPKSRMEPPPLASSRERRNDDWRALLHPTGEYDSAGAAIYALEAPPPACGQFAFELRIYPWHELLAHPLELGLLKRM